MAPLTQGDCRKKGSEELGGGGVHTPRRDFRGMESADCEMMQRAPEEDIMHTGPEKDDRQWKRGRGPTVICMTLNGDRALVRPPP